MTWQDVVLSLGSGIFSAALLPTVFADDKKPAASTSVITATVLASFVVVYITLHLWFSAAATAVNGALWAVLFAQALRTKEK